MKSLRLNRMLLCVAVLLIAPLTTLCCFVDPYSVSNTNHEASRPFHIYQEVGDLEYVELSGINGSIEIIGDEDITEVEIWGEMRVESESKSDAAAHLDDVDVEVTTAENLLYIRTVQPNETHGRNYVVDYHLLVPESWESKIISINGDIQLESLRNTILAGLTNGDVALLDVRAETHVEVVNGKIAGDVTIPPSGYLTMHIVNGEIIVDIPKETSANFAASVTNGEIKITNLEIHNLQTTLKTAQGILGDGDGDIQLGTVNGPIHVRGF